MDKIRNVLEVIRQLASEHLGNIDRRGDEWLVLTSIVDHDGTVNETTRDKLVMNLYSITREDTISTYNPALPGAGGFAMVAPPLYIDLHLIFMANFIERKYPDGLAAISWFNHDNAPLLHPDIDKLTLEFVNLSPVDVNYVMGMLGTKYLPSVFYKLRMIPFASSAMQARTYPVGAGVPQEKANPPVGV